MGTHVATLQGNRRDTRVEWANLPGVPSDFQPRSTAGRASDASTALDGLLWASLLVAMLTAAPAPLLWGAAALVGAELLVLLIAAVPARRARRTRRRAQTDEDLIGVRAALAALEPRTLFSFAGPAAVPPRGAVVRATACSTWNACRSSPVPACTTRCG